jgi:hypothetical protein
MVLQGIIETPDIPTVYNHGDAGEGMALLLPVLVLLLLCFLVVLTEFPKKELLKAERPEYLLPDWEASS